jgi:hypothetical protein
VLLVLCGLDDLVALWFARQAQSRGVACRIVTGEELSFARRRSQRLRGRRVSSLVELADGFRITDDGHDVSGVLNRLTSPPAAAWSHAAVNERHYAFAELHAFTLSWLSGLPSVVRNRPQPESLAGPAPHPLLALAVAAASGLSTPHVHLDGELAEPTAALRSAAVTAAGARAERRQVVCLDGRVLTPGIPAAVRRGSEALLPDLGMSSALVGIDFLIGRDQWWFAGTTPLPDLHASGDDVVEELLQHLAAEPGAS